MSQSYCRLFLATPDCFDLPKLQHMLGAAISGGDIACLLIRQTDTGKLKEAAMALTGMAQQAGIAVVIDTDVEIALACGADGVQVAGDVHSYVDAREKIGADKIVGVYCGSDRHAAMSMGEAGADYVAFSNEAADGDLEPEAHWWARLFEVPCVVSEPLEIEQAREAAAKRIDFIRPSKAMWTDDKAAEETVRLYNAMIRDTQIETD